MRIFAEGFSDIGAPERVAEMLRDGVARSLEAGPFVSMLEGRDRHSSPWSNPTSAASAISSVDITISGGSVE
jgi:hypothetical protein